MAITNANFNNVDYVKVAGKRIITCSSDKIGTSNVFNYKFLLEITYDGNTYSYTFRPNDNDYGIINITKILQTFGRIKVTQEEKTIPSSVTASTSETVAFNQSIFDAPHFDKTGSTLYPLLFSTNDSFRKVELELFDFYGTTVDEVPTKQTAGSQSATMYIISGYDRESDLINVDYTQYKLDGTTKLFITSNHEDEGSHKAIRNLFYKDFGTISFLGATKGVNENALPNYFQVRYYKFTGTQIGSMYIPNSALYGGQVPNTTLEVNYLLTVGCYPANLNKLPSSFTRPIDVKSLSLGYYEVFFSSDVAGSSEVSKRYRFYHSSADMSTDCGRYDRQRFAYVNSFGAFEYITFTEIRTDNITSSKTNIKGSVFNYQGTYNYGSYTSYGKEYREQAYVPNVAHQSEKIISTNFNETFTVNTGFLSKSDTKKVEELFLSARVIYLDEEGSARSVILENSSINTINNPNKNYEQVSYSLTFRYSIPTYNETIF